MPPERRSSALWRAQRGRLEVPDADCNVYITLLRGHEDAQALWLDEVLLGFELGSRRGP